jgi:hypothetical protein
MHESRQTVEHSATLAEPERAPITEQEDWLEDAGELPPRPRRRILAPIPVALFVALAVACGFIGGVLVEKGQGGSGTSTGGSGAFAALARRSASTSGGGSGSTGSAAGSGAAFARGSGGFGGAAGAAATGGTGGSGATVGEVAYLSGSTLYVKTAEGNTVKVTPAPGAKVTKTVEAHVKGIHPGETVLIAGSAAKNGSISASSIRAGSATGGLGLGGGALLSGAGSGGGGSSAAPGAGAGATGSAGGESSQAGPALFGKE